jgi:hypothetical protein
MRLPWQKRRDDDVDANRPHEFRSALDGGIAALTPIGGGVGRRTIGCAVPGCGKPPDALIDAPEE